MIAHVAVNPTILRSQPRRPLQIVGENQRKITIIKRDKYHKTWDRRGRDP